MPNATWPSTLPNPQADNVSYADVDNALRTQMDAGVDKVRRRYTAVAVPCSVTLQLTEAQVDTLDNFEQTTLGGVLPFDWLDFRKPSLTVAATYRFKKRPKYSTIPNSVDKVLATLQLEMMP